MDDITLASGIGDSLHFYVNNFGQFEQIANPVPNTMDARSVIWADYDNDGDKDFFVTSYRTNDLYRNDGGMNFTKVTAAAPFSTNVPFPWL